MSALGWATWANKLSGFGLGIMAGSLLGCSGFMALIEKREGVEGGATLAKGKLIVGAVGAVLKGEGVIG